MIDIRGCRLPAGGRRDCHQPQPALCTVGANWGRTVKTVCKVGWPSNPSVCISTINRVCNHPRFRDVSIVGHFLHYWVLSSSIGYNLVLLGTNWHYWAQLAHLKHYQTLFEIFRFTIFIIFLF